MRSIIKINNFYKPQLNFGFNLIKSINSFRFFNFSTVNKEILQKVKVGESLSNDEFKQLISNLRTNPELIKDAKIEQTFTAHIPSNISEVNIKELNDIMTIFMQSENLPSNDIINIIQKRQGELGEREVSASNMDRDRKEERSTIRNSEERGSESNASQGNQIYVSNLPWSARDQDLEETFGKFGEVSVANVVMDRETGRSRGFGFVTFSNAQARDAALQENHSILGRNVFARIANERKPKREGEEEPRFNRDRESSYSQRNSQESRGSYGEESERPQRTERGEGFNRSSNFDENKTVFLGNLDFGVTEDKIRDEFSDCGSIAKLRLPKHLDGNIKGMCFIEFESERSVEEALRKSGQNLNGRSVRVTKYTTTPPPKKYGDGEGRSFSSRPSGRDYGRDSNRDSRGRSSSEGGNRGYSRRNMRNEDQSD